MEIYPPDLVHHTDCAGLRTSTHFQASLQLGRAAEGFIRHIPPETGNAGQCSSAGLHPASGTVLLP